MTANEITKQAIKLLESRGCKVWRQNQIPVKGRAFIGERGQPDIIGFNASTGVFVGVEVKAAGDKLSDEQIAFLSRLHVSGGISMVAKEIDTKVVLIGFGELTTYK